MKFPDFSVVLFRSNFMPFSEKSRMKAHTNQCFWNTLFPPDIPWGAMYQGTPMVSGVQTSSQYPDRVQPHSDVGVQPLENKALSRGIIRKSACIHDEITIWKSQLPWISVAANARWIAELAVQRQLPTIFRNRVFADAGGFMTYGA